MTRSGAPIVYGRNYTGTGAWADETGSVHDDDTPPDLHPEWHPAEPSADDLHDAAEGGDAIAANSWTPIDLGPYLRGEVKRPEPSVGIVRGDGLRLLYPGKEHAVIGEMEAGKSWFCLACAAAELAADRHVVYIHFEESDPSDSVERLQALGVSDVKIADRFHFVGPERMVNRNDLDRLLDVKPSLVILDGVNEAMSLHGWAIRDEDGAAAFRRHLVKPCTGAGAATLAADHVVKDRERRGRNALGSVHKGNGLSGALILLENEEPFGRGQRGRSHLSITKDRPGYLRRHGRPDHTVPGRTYLGELIVDDARESVNYLDLQFVEAKKDRSGDDPRRSPAPSLSDNVLSVIAAQPDQCVPSARRLYAAMRGAGHKARNQHVCDAVEDLVVTGRLVEFTGPKRATGYRLSASQE